MTLSPPRFWLRSLLLGSASVSPSPSFSLLENKWSSSYRGAPHAHPAISLPQHPLIHTSIFLLLPALTQQLTVLMGSVHPTSTSVSPTGS